MLCTLNSFTSCHLDGGSYVFYVIDLISIIEQKENKSTLSELCHLKNLLQAPPCLQNPTCFKGITTAQFLAVFSCRHVDPSRCLS